MYDIFSIKDFSFPDNFIWGSGYAGHQVEGNNIHSQNWKREQEGATLEKSGLACNSYELFETDARLVKELGHRAFRTSVEWSRIEPEEGVIDEEAVNHYIKFFSSLKEKGIKVFATLVHFTVPLWFSEKKSFGDINNMKYFERHLEYIVPKLAPYVDYWNVMNEFNLIEDVDFKLNYLRFHAHGYHIIKKYSKAPVSSAHALVDYYPKRRFSELDNLMAKYRDYCGNEFFFHAIRTGEIVYPHHDEVIDPDVKGSVDFWSINMYTREMVDARLHNGHGKPFDHKRLRMIDMDFYLEEMFPECFIDNLSRLTDKPVIITENGCSCDDDRFRIVYTALHLSALAEAIKNGADVRGYLHWSLLDNYEWSSFKPRFGLCSVDLKTFERTPKNSAYFYRDIIEHNGFNQNILRKYLKEMPSLAIK